MSNSSPVLEVDGLSKRFVLHERGKVIEACRDSSFSVRIGEMTMLVGASGAGKSSVLKCVHRTYLPTAGRIHYWTRDGERLALEQIAEEEVLVLRRREIRFISQFLHALPRQAAVDVVARPLLELGRPLDESRSQAREMLGNVGLPERLWDVAPHTFSGGERQLVNIARALIVRPRLLLLDEPAASLDPASTEQVVQVIERLKREEMALLGVFHDRRIVERLADQTISMEGGVSWDKQPSASGNQHE